MILKVKEPIELEWARLRKGQVVFTYFHFAASEPLTKAVIKSGCVAIAYETVELPSKELPLLTPMSEVAGRMAVQEGAKYLEKVFGGYGILLGGVPGVLPAEVLILGGGVVVRGRDYSLCCRQHAGRGAAHVDAGAHQRDISVCQEAGAAWVEGGV